MAKFKVRYTETAVFEFEVRAMDEGDALAVARNILLGAGDMKGALQFVPPDDTPISCDIPEREWDVTKL